MDAFSLEAREFFVLFKHGIGYGMSNVRWTTYGKDKGNSYTVCYIKYADS
jgi:hypothetical protein